MKYHHSEYEYTIAKWANVTGAASMLAQAHGSIKWKDVKILSGKNFRITICLN